MIRVRVKKFSSTKKWLERLLLVAGVVGISVWVGSIAINTIWQDWEGFRFDHEVRGETVTVGGYLSARVRDEKEQLQADIRRLRGLPDPRIVSEPPAIPTPAPQPVAPKPNPPKPVIGNDGLIGRLSIPRLKLSVIVRQGVNEDTLTVAAGHIPGTALPGESGNVAVAGHRDTLFRGLRNIRKNDLIHFETLAGNYDYRVGSTQIVKPEDVGVLNPGPSPELTLVTCYPFYYIGSAPDRFIVKATQVGASAEGVPKTELISKVAPPPPAPRPIEPVRPKPISTALKTVATVRPKPPSTDLKVTFVISRNHSRQLAPGISMGVSDTDMTCHCMNGWMWLMPERRTIWLRNQDTRNPVVFYGFKDGKRRELWITKVDENSVAGYLVPAA